ncbi:hypothetical protein HY768_02975 [candidate division TA06 bacterium]|uniref:Lipoprotein n=1 Tax=candidate division TA06 bacterium TaxID=2250710 RepID=A0A933I977_UNCT6|nr:hypothetical protein [candidate division TA06 bacterium]
MRNKILSSLLAATIIAAVVFSGCSKEPPASVKPPVPEDTLSGDYFPLVTGSKWIYAWTINGSTYTVTRTVIDTVILWGMDTVKCVVENGPPVTDTTYLYTDTTYFKKTASGITEHNKNGDLICNRAVFPLIVGRKWGTGTNDYSFLEMREAVTIDTVRYPECFKLRYKNYRDNTASGCMWFARDVGFVEGAIQGTIVLKSYKTPPK